MAHYMMSLRYTEQSVKAMVAKPSDRKAAATGMIEGFGGKLNQFYFAFGAFDAVLIYEIPDHVNAMAITMALGATGAVSDIQTTVLISAKDAEAAMEKAHGTKTGYKPPGG